MSPVIAGCTRWRRNDRSSRVRLKASVAPIADGYRRLSSPPITGRDRGHANAFRRPRPRCRSPSPRAGGKRQRGGHERAAAGGRAFDLDSPPSGGSGRGRPTLARSRSPLVSVTGTFVGFGAIEATNLTSVTVVSG